MCEDKEVKATTKACTKLVPPPTKQASNINASLEVSDYKGFNSSNEFLACYYSK